MTVLRWFRGRLFGMKDLPRRWTWLLVFAACHTAMTWIGGRTW